MMKILMISGDKQLLNPESDAGKRLTLMRAEVDQLDVFVWPQVHSWWQIFQAARGTDYNIITAQDPFFRGVLAWKLTWITRAKLNVQVHADLQGQSLFRHMLAQIMLRHADSVRVVSEKLRAQVQSYGVTCPIRVLPVYVDLERFARILPLEHAQKTILWIGRFEPEKAPLEALRALRQVRGQGVDARLIMLGQGSLEGVLRKEAEGMPVEFPGWGDPATYLPTADVVLCTSLNESWGASIVEALAAGVPVVAPDVGIAREAGAIVVAREQLGKAVARVLRDGGRSVLKLSLPSAREWAQEWRKTLV